MNSNKVKSGERLIELRKKKKKKKKKTKKTKKKNDRKDTEGIKKGRKTGR